MHKWIAMGALALALGGCGGQFGNISNIGRHSDPARFYLLTSEAEQPVVSLPRSVIGVGPVTTADYLDRSQMVVRDSANHLDLQEFERWAGNLPKEVQKVVVANLITLTGTQNVLHHPWKSSLDTDYTLEIYVEQMDYDRGEATLVIQWQLYEGNGRHLVLSRRSHWKEAVAKDYDLIASSLSKHMGAFTEEVAQEISARSTAAVPHQVKHTR